MCFTKSTQEPNLSTLKDQPIYPYRIFNRDLRKHFGFLVLSLLSPLRTNQVTNPGFDFGKRTSQNEVRTPRKSGELGLQFQLQQQAPQPGAREQTQETVSPELSVKECFLPPNPLSSNNYMCTVSLYYRLVILVGMIHV